MNILWSLNRLLATRFKTAVSSLKHVRRSTSKFTSYDLKTHSEKDALLFHFENPKYFVVLNTISAVHCIFLTYLGFYLFKTLKNTPIEEFKNKSWGRLLEKERKYSNILFSVPILFGWVLLAATIFYSFRSIRKIILNKGGKTVTIVTYNLPGYNTIEVPLINVCDEFV